VSSRVQSLQRQAAKPTNGNGTNPESEAVKKAVELRQAREKKCADEINEVLAKYNCQFSISLQAGNQLVPLNKIVALPGAVQITSK
jgi:hypothetical protein